MHGKIKKSVMQKALDKLVEKEELQLKEFGKNKVYLLNQNAVPDFDEKDMAELKVRLAERKAEHNQLDEECKKLNKIIKDTSAQLTNEELEQ